MLEVEILKFNVSDGKVEKVKDCVAEEKPLSVFLNRKQYAIIYCSPQNLKELTAGHLLSEGIINSVEEIEEISLRRSACYVRVKTNVPLENRLKLSRHLFRIILSGCGGASHYQLSKNVSNLKVEPEIILNCVNRLNFIAETFRRTGGVHVATIYKPDGNLVCFAEDVGRHNAVDKVIGIAALNKIDFGMCFLALSGRLTGDIVLKAARVGLPIIASLAAAVDSGIAIAKDANLTLIGFVRGKRMNVYSFPERILS